MTDPQKGPALGTPDHLWPKGAGLAHDGALATLPDLRQGVRPTQSAGAAHQVGCFEYVELLNLLIRIVSILN